MAVKTIWHIDFSCGHSGARDLSATLLTHAGFQQIEDWYGRRHLPAPRRPGRRAPDDLGLTLATVPFPEQELPR
ncbi:hypothetical protein [Streptomyces sp. NPDC005423]|uniref:hypothetical protein n=1 Tax=Streptomyces sp. NPDC005423 TaxID=3155343 RepID=UPI0033A61320